MEALATLRKHLLDKLNIAAENVKTFIEAGDIYSASAQGANKNDNFRVTYKAVIYIDNPSDDHRYIFWIIAQWMNKHFPNRPAGSIKYEADILSHEESILEFTLDLYEDIEVTVGEDKSVTLQSCFLIEDDPILDIWVNEAGKHEPASP